MFQSPTFDAIKSSWALFIGIAFIMLAQGLQGTLLPLRATMEGFSTSLTGIIMSGYFVGVMVGSIYAPKLVQRVGHIRVFAALASLASITILVHSLFVNVWTWTLMRLVTGVSFAGLYVVAESWINDRATNENRGQVLSLYTLIVFSSMGLGQLLLNMSDPRGVELFVLTSILVSVALIPILLTARPAPTYEWSERVSVATLFRITPFGVFATIATGLAHGSLFSMGAVFGQLSGMNVAQISWFMAAFLLGGLLFQWPIGRFSDRFDRRRLLIMLGGFGFVIAMSAIWVPVSNITVLIFLAVLLGGTALPLYSMCIAATNDRLAPEQMVGASGSLVLASGIGLSFGPLCASTLMNALGPRGYFVSLALPFIAIVLFGIYRIIKRASAPADGHVPYIAAAQGESPVGIALVAETALEQLESTDDNQTNENKVRVGNES